LNNNDPRIPKPKFLAKNRLKLCFSLVVYGFPLFSGPQIVKTVKTKTLNNGYTKAALNGLSLFSKLWTNPTSVANVVKVNIRIRNHYFLSLFANEKDSEMHSG